MVQRKAFWSRRLHPPSHLLTCPWRPTCPPARLPTSRAPLLWMNQSRYTTAQWKTTRESTMKWSTICWGTFGSNMLTLSIRSSHLSVDLKISIPQSHFTPPLFPPLLTGTRAAGFVPTVYSWDDASSGSCGREWTAPPWHHPPVKTDSHTWTSRSGLDSLLPSMTWTLWENRAPDSLRLKEPRSPTDLRAAASLKHAVKTVEWDQIQPVNIRDFNTTHVHAASVNKQASTSNTVSSTCQDPTSESHLE